MLKQLIWVVLLTMPAYAGDGDFVLGPAQIAADRKILQALQSTVNATWSGPLQNVMEDLRKATGVPFNIDRQVFEDAGENPDLPVTCEFGKVSAQEAIRRLGHDWTIVDGAIWLRPAGSDEPYSVRAYDISKLTRWLKLNSSDATLEAQVGQLDPLNGLAGDGVTQRRRVLRRAQNDTSLEQRLIGGLVMQTTSGPWMVQDQDGGTIDATSDRLFVRQKFSRHLEVAGTLDAFEQLVTSDGSLKPVRFRAWDDPVAEEQSLQAALDSVTTVKFADTKLEDAFKMLAEKHNIRFDFDPEDGVDTERIVSLEMTDVRLQNVLTLMLEPLQLTSFAHEGVLRIVPSGHDCGRLHQLTGYRLDQIPLAADPKALTELIHSQTSGQWMAVDQEGGSLIWVGSKILLVSAEPRIQSEVAELLRELKPSVEGAARVAPDADPRKMMEVQLYKFDTEKQARQVRRAIPLIVTGSDELHSIKRVGSHLVIEATLPGHEQVDRFLQSLKEEKPQPKPVSAANFF